MKIDLGPLDPGTPWGQRGLYVVRWTRWGPIAAKWPTPGAFKNAKGKKWLRWQFGQAGYMAANAMDIDLQAAVQAAKNSMQVPRDQLTSAMYGNLIEIVGPDGLRWPVSDKNEPAPPPPPPPEQEEEMWNWTLWDEAWNGTMNSATNAAKGMVIQPRFDILVKGTRLNFQPASGVTYRCTIAKIDSSDDITEIIATADAIAPSASRQVMQWPIIANIPAGQRVVFLWSNPFGSNGSPFPVTVSTSNHSLVPLQSWGRAQLAKAVPAVGDSLGFTSGGGVPFAFLT